MTFNLVQRLQGNGWTRVAFIGTAKHAGKTTAMNTAILQAESLNIPLGLVSIGLDGERLDTILGVEKPSVYVPEGTLVASAEKALLQSNIQLEYLEDTGISSPLGNVLVARALLPGNVLLAGVRQRIHLQQVLPRFLQYGVEMVFVDGAFDRVAAAAPNLADAAVLVVGAVSGKTVDSVITSAYPFLQRFRLPLLEEELRKVFSPVVDSGEVAAWDGHTLLRFSRHQGILGLHEDTRWHSGVTHLFVSGAISDALLENLLSHPQPLQVIAGHPAQVMASAAVLQRWFRRGHSLVLWNTLPIAAVAVNPYSIQGYQLSGEELAAGLANWIPDVPIYNALEDTDAIGLTQGNMRPSEDEHSISLSGNTGHGEGR